MPDQKQLYISNYSDLKISGWQSIKIRSRRLVLDSLAGLNELTGKKNELNRPRVQFIYVHHLFKDEEQKFASLIENLQKHHEFISYTDAINKVVKGEINKPYISISSDDGFKSNQRMASMLDPLGIKACFFINPFIIDKENYGTIQDYCKNRLHFPPVEFLSWIDIERLQKNGHEIGAHTTDHKNLALFDYDSILSDLQQCKEILEKYCGLIRHFAFPFGRFRHFSEEARKACFDSGYGSCASAERGCHMNVQHPVPYNQLCIRRDHVIVNWSYRHIQYFLINNVRKYKHMDNFFPYSAEA